MKVAIYNNNEPRTLQARQHLIQLLKQHDIQVDDTCPDLIISIGGDGTLIGTFHHYESFIHTVPFVGIHTGHLGFYTDWHVNQLDDFVDLIAHKKPELFDCPLIKVTIYYLDGRIQSYHALNEATVRKSNGHTQVSDVYIDQQFLEEFRGDGLCFSTPTGSTAYNKSIGGAIVGPEIKAFQMAEIASLNNVVYRTLTSPVLIPDFRTVHVKLHNPHHTLVTVDQTIITDPVQQIEFTMDNQIFKLACYHQENFWQRVQAAFIGQTPSPKE